MSDYFFVDDLPIRIDRAYFRSRYGSFFPDLLPEDKNAMLDANIDDVYTMFRGVNTLWNRLPREDYYKKTQMCFGLLTAWYIADLFPEFTAGVVMSGGIPLKSKSIGGIKIAFGDPSETSAGVKAYKDMLAVLKSNPFGAKAYTMIMTSSAKMRILGRSR